jgi:valyl-tRNA synthetase
MTTETAPPAAGGSKAYDPKAVEERLYRFWEEGGFFQPRLVPGKRPFTIIMPPPNVTGALHLGHALPATMEDIMVRWHRMMGDPTLWLPGEDHAGIAGQNVVEKLLAEEGLTRHDLGRERFVERVWEWMHKYRHVIADQHRRLGASCDWTRERFTMDPGPARGVRTTFVNLYNKGLIYRGERIINWCPRCMTALSDLEVDHEETLGSLWYVRYPLKPIAGASEAAFVTVATTRPETILGDTGVAVNPDDPRWSAYIGRTAILPVLGREIPIVADAAVDPQFGTGAVKVTPGHDPTDFEIGQRHGLATLKIMNDDASLNKLAGPYAGLDRFEARARLVADLERQGLLEKVEPHTYAIGHCQRCDTIVEPMVSLQWFVDIKPLARPAIDAVVSGAIRIVPERFAKVYLNWMENIRDWCISRQLWWGHRIPVWYCDACKELTVAVEEPERCAHCGSAAIHQDPDVLDTWFSSGLWTHTTLGWPDDTEDLRTFYPTSVMETGYDILFFWVARMIMLGIENMGAPPFHTVYLHGLVRDAKGEKMSKSKGNVIDPLISMDQYGTDALRFALAVGSAPGNDLKLSDERLAAGRNFANKLWNAANFIVAACAADGGRRKADTRGEPPSAVRRPPSALADRWIESRLQGLIASVAQLMGDCQFGEAGRQIQEFIWGEFCDWYLEMAKVSLRADGGRPTAGGESSPSAVEVLPRVFDAALRLLHPFMPFVTEEIWQRLRAGGLIAEPAPALIVAAYPTPDPARIDPAAERIVESAMALIRAVRNARAELRIEPARWLEGILVIGGEAAYSRLAPSIAALARLRPLRLEAQLDRKPDQAVTVIAGELECYLPLAGVLDLAAETERLRGELAEVESEIARAQGRLANPSFTGRAPAAVVDKEREKLAAYEERAVRLRERVASLV